MRPPRQLARLLIIREVAELLRVKESTVRTWINSGSLRAIKFGREWRVSPIDLQTYLDAKANKPAAEQELAAPREAENGSKA